MINFSVIMPTFNQSAFIRRAISSLLRQTYSNWELRIINDGCTDETDFFVKDYLSDSRISYIKNPENKGLGFAVNQGIDKAKYDYIAYLPSDDYYFDSHLSHLKEAFEKSEDVVLAYTAATSEVKDSLIYEEKSTINGLLKNYCLQLVQTAHRKTSDRWTTRDEWVTYDYFDLFWRKLIDKGEFAFVNETTCYWTNHPKQHHKLVSELYGGGINIFRQHYNIKEPFKYKASKLSIVDEKKMYDDFIKIRKVQCSDNPLKILIVGELAYHPERILAFEERGHKLYGLWVKRPTHSFSSVGPMQFRNNITDISFGNWENEIKEIKPDIIYATQNMGVENLAHDVFMKFPEIPFVWHFKESPFNSIKNGTWDKVIELYQKSDGVIYPNIESKYWYEQFIPERECYMILDGDLLNADCLTDDFSPLLSDTDGEIHTVCPGRLVGVDAEAAKVLVDNKIHIHLYADNIVSAPFHVRARNLASDYFHLHPQCSIAQWVKEFSKYDAGWLHCFDSHNNGKIEHLGWDDLNIPARVNVLAAAGLPMITNRNKGHIVAMRSYVEKNEMSVLFDDFNELATLLKDKSFMRRIRENVISNRHSFSFDYHVDDVIDFFRKTIETKKVL